MKRILILTLISILLVSCTPQDCTTQGYILPTQCPKCKTVVTPIQPEEDYLYIYFIDVGQGDAELIKYKDTEMLIDCGKNTMGPTVVDFLKDEGVDKLEYLMITHPDSDHIGGCDDVLREIQTHTVITNGNQKDTYSYNDVIEEINSPEGYQEQLITGHKGDSWSIGPATMTVLQADNNMGDENQNSIVSKLVYNHVSALFTGDCDNQCEELLLDKDIKSDILKVAHHGTKFASSARFLDKMDPDIAVISVGYNSYGHPTEETLDRLAEDGIIVYRTDKDGTISIKINGMDYEVE